MTPPAPYAADVKAKGWRFELDHERIRQSDTWALASPEARPWLLMLWMTAWEQVPCGSLPNSDELVAARIGMAPKAFAKVRHMLMRGWWLADDGRLYHSTIITRVMEMMECRKKNADRVAKHKLGKRDSRGSNALPAGEKPASNDTGTGTGTGTGTPSIEGVVRATPGEACLAMKAAGMSDVNPSHPKLIALLDAGMTVPELAEATSDAVGKGKPFAYALATAEGRRRDAAVAALPALRGKQSPESFAERDRIAGMERWEEMTGQSHPDLERMREQGALPRRVVIEAQPIEVIAHEPAHQSH